MKTPPPEWMGFAARALPALAADVTLWSDVNADLEAFFAAHPQVVRNVQSETTLRVVIFQRLTRDQDNATQTERIV